MTEIKRQQGYIDLDGTSSDAARAARDAIVLCAAEVGRRMRGGQ